MTEAKAMIASVSSTVHKVINRLYDSHQRPDSLPWARLAGPLAAADDALARLDERLRASPIREGWIARTHFADACASLWLDGELVHLEDLVLHDAGMDLRAPTYELTRAHTVLRARRRISGAEPGWALTSAGMEELRGRAGQGRSDQKPSGVVTDEEIDDFGTMDEVIAEEGPDALFAEAFAALDAAVARTSRAVASTEIPMSERDPLVYDLDWDEDKRLAEWREAVGQTRNLPPTLAAVIALDAWDAIEPLQHLPWLGRLLVTALLRERGKTRSHLACLNVGLRAAPRERRCARDAATRLVARIDAIAAAADAGIKDHDRWLTARNLLARKAVGRRSTSRLPALVDYVLSRPVVSAAMIADALRVTPRAAQDLVAELGLRETTGRGRYRAWGII